MKWTLTETNIYPPQKEIRNISKILQIISFPHSSFFHFDVYLMCQIY